MPIRIAPVTGTVQVVHGHCKLMRVLVPLVAELVERFKNLGVCASRASVTAALVEMGLELEFSGSSAVAPARTRDRMDPGA
jgi:hypothetical protein